MSSSITYNAEDVPDMFKEHEIEIVRDIVITAK